MFGLKFPYETDWFLYFGKVSRDSYLKFFSFIFEYAFFRVGLDIKVSASQINKTNVKRHSH